MAKAAFTFKQGPDASKIVKAGAVRYLDGSTVAEALDDALITENGTSVYRVDDGIPVMLEERGIPTSQLDSF